MLLERLHRLCSRRQVQSCGDQCHRVGVTGLRAAAVVVALVMSGAVIGVTDLRMVSTVVIALLKGVGSGSRVRLHRRGDRQRQRHKHQQRQQQLTAALTQKAMQLQAQVVKHGGECRRLSHPPTSYVQGTA